MIKQPQSLLATALSLALLVPAQSHAVSLGSETITFDDAINGVPFYNFDTNDPDMATDVVFTTTDPSGFNTSGPGPNQLFVDEPGLEGTTGLNVDLRVDFLQGAVGQISFGFATIDTGSVTFTAYNAAGIPIGTQSTNSIFTTLPSGSSSGFPENEVIVPLAGTAVYGEFNFELPSDGTGGGGIGPGDGDGGGLIELAGRYLLDNFSFTPAGEDIISTVIGALPENPILPGEIIVGSNGVPEFNFDIIIDENGIGGLFPIFIDPVVAIGYEYNSTVAISEVLIPDSLPNGDDTFRLILPGFGEFILQAGVPFDLLSINSAGFTNFTIDGIDTNELLDPNDPFAFVTGLRYVGGGQANTSMTPITFDTDAQVNPVPTPGTLFLFGAGLIGLLWRSKRVN